MGTAPARATFRFYAELNDHLPPGEQFRAIECEFFVPASVKAMIEGLGVPHTEVDLVLVNGVSRGFDWRVQDGDHISVYPVFEAFDIAGVTRLRPEPLREPRFVLDIHLGKLAAYLRMAGFDTFYRNCYTDAELAAISSREQRTLLTRDVGLLKRSEVTHGYFVRETAPRRQLAEVVKRFDLRRLLHPFTRCMRCNGVLQAASKEDVAAGLPERTGRLYEEFARCPECRRVYWKGGHYRRMQEIFEDLGLY